MRLTSRKTPGVGWAISASLVALTLSACGGASSPSAAQPKSLQSSSASAAPTASPTESTEQRDINQCVEIDAMSLSEYNALMKVWNSFVKIHTLSPDGSDLVAGYHNWTEFENEMRPEHPYVTPTWCDLSK